MEHGTSLGGVWLEEAQTILSPPLDPLNKLDKLIWGAIENGVFSIKSTYKVALSFKKNIVGEGSKNTMEGNNFWKFLCSLPIHVSAKKILWRASTNTLPTKSNV